MNKQEKLAKLQPLLNRLEQLERQLQRKEAVQNLNPDVYGSGLDFVFSEAKKKYNQKNSWLNKINNSKLVRGARVLGKYLEEDFDNIFSNLSLQIIDTINSINKKSKLIPKYDNIIEKVSFIVDSEKSNIIKDYILSYEDNLVNIFRQGKFHKLQYKNQALVDNDVIKKIASKNIESDALENFLSKSYSSEIINKFSDMRKDIFVIIKKCIDEKYDRVELNNEIEKYIKSVQGNFKDSLHEHFINTYSMGNLFQLKQDNVHFIRWQMNNPLSECIECRALQNGDVILEYNGSEISHKSELFGTKVYNFNEIWEIANKKGARFFNHSDCTCTFIAAN